VPARRRAPYAATKGGDVESVTLPLHCPYCGRTRDYEAPGRVLWVAMRLPSDEPETRH